MKKTVRFTAIAIACPAVPLVARIRHRAYGSYALGERRRGGRSDGRILCRWERSERLARSPKRRLRMGARRMGWERQHRVPRLRHAVFWRPTARS
jgi:hypothetical protein